LVSGEYPPMEGGVGAFTEQLARALNAQGHEVHVVVPKQCRPADASRRLSDINEPAKVSYGYLHPRTGRWRWSTMSTVADIAIRQELDVLNLQYQAAAYNMNSPAPNFLPWRLSGVLPVVVTFHDLRPPYLLPKAGGMRERALQFMARQTRGVIATNAADRRMLAEWNIPSVREIPIGSNISVYEPNHIEVAEAREQCGVGPDDVLLGYFGFLNESKGGATLIEALASLDDRHHLVFIGGQTGASDGTNNAAYLAELRDLIDRTGLTGRVHWTGYLPDQRVSTYLTAADLIVMPYRDGVSLRRGTLMAALAHARPVITTQPPEPIDELADGAVWLVPPDDPAALAAAVRELATDPGRRAELGRAAADLAGRFSWESIAAQTAAYFRELVAADQRQRVG
jgi:glycosyltransferase involved in cell wall biosynthesis